jgi:uncharacterized membrane protein YkoI
MKAAHTMLAIALCAIACDPNDDDDTVDDVRITLLEAIAIAESEVPVALTLDAELIVEDEAVYDVDRWLDGETHEVILDARTGEVLEIDIVVEDEVETAQQVAALQGAAIGLVDAIDTALANHDGTAVSAEIGDDLATVIVVLVHDDQPMAVIVSLADGSIVGTDDPPADDD